MRTLLAFISTAVIFISMDFVFITMALGAVYKPRIGALLMEKPNFAAAGVFYLIYLSGVLFFAVLPALEQGSWQKAFGYGAALGFVAYATYDMTNLATLKGWDWFMSGLDMAWGTFATGLAATAGYFVTRHFLPAAA